LPAGFVPDPAAANTPNHLQTQNNCYNNKDTNVIAFSTYEDVAGFHFLGKDK